MLGCPLFVYLFRQTDRQLKYVLWTCEPSLNTQLSVHFKHCINQYIFSTWQDDWNGVVMNKLHSVKPVLGEWQSSYTRCRKDEVVLCRARIGHTHLTHSYILKKDPPPVCEHCQCNLTVRHILVECNHFAQERKDIFGRRDVVESFRFQPTLIVLFLKQIQFYYTF